MQADWNSLLEVKLIAEPDISHPHDVSEPAYLELQEVDRRKDLGSSCWDMHGPGYVEGSV